MGGDRGACGGLSGAQWDSNPNQCSGHGVRLVFYLLQSALYTESLLPGDAIGL